MMGFLFCDIQVFRSLLKFSYEKVTEKKILSL